MSRVTRGFTVFVISLPLSLCLAGATVAIHREVPMVTGNMCRPTTGNPQGNCYGQLPVGGWPFPFLYDTPGVSVVGHLSMLDDFKPGWFVLDAALFSALFALGVVLFYRLRPRRPGEPPWG